MEQMLVSQEQLHKPLESKPLESMISAPITEEYISPVVVAQALTEQSSADPTLTLRQLTELLFTAGRLEQEKKTGIAFNKKEYLDQIIAAANDTAEPRFTIDAAYALAPTMHISERASVDQARELMRQYWHPPAVKTSRVLYETAKTVCAGAIMIPTAIVYYLAKGIFAIPSCIRAASEADSKLPEKEQNNIGALGTVYTLGAVVAGFGELAMHLSNTQHSHMFWKAFLAANALSAGYEICRHVYLDKKKELAEQNSVPNPFAPHKEVPVAAIAPKDTA
jgi:hypothetical protein